ncbi:MAG: OmpA family protein [Bacteroidota bacterium]
MNHYKKIFVLLIAFALTIPVFAQKATLKKANELFEKLAYYEAVPYYLRVLQIDSADSEALHKIAESYRRLNDYQNTEKYFSKVVMLQDVTPIEKYYYGLSLMENNKYNEAKKWISFYQKLVPADERGENKLTGIEKLNYFLQDSTSYTISNYFHANGDHSDFGPIYYNKGILFSSNRYLLDEMGNKHSWTGKDFYKVFYFDSTNMPKPVKFSSSVQTRFNDGPVSFDIKNNLLYVTRNQVEDGKAVKASDDQIKLQIYAYKYDDAKKEWSDEIIFSNNNKDYNVAHPSVTPDGSTLIFSSDIPGGYGGMDLYLCKKEDEIWGAPVNLGITINTKGNEVFPFVNADNLLIFSSNGLEGLGGLDIYYTFLKDGKVTTIEHFGYPVNSQLDDFSMVLNDDYTNAFFSSNRIGGKGDDDIYNLIIFKKLKPENPVFNLALNGIVKDKKTLELLNNVKVVITDEKAITYTGFSLPTGTFKVPVKVRLNDTIILTLMLEKKGYLREELKYTYLVIDSNNVDLNKSLELLMTPLEAVIATDLIGEDLMKNFIINPIYFDFDKYNIRADAASELDKIVAIMNEYPKMVIDIASHTDCRGSYDYNIALSDNRCKSTIEYIVAKGISKDRLTGKGYGETKLVNDCACEGGQASSCTPAMHQLNRRSEFIVVKM